MFDTAVQGWNPVVVDGRVTAADAWLLVTLVQLVVGIVQLASTARDVNGPVFVAYLLGLVVVLPLASVWALAENSRWGTGVLVIGGLVLLVLVARLQQLWTGVGV